MTVFFPYIKFVFVTKCPSKVGMSVFVELLSEMRVNGWGKLPHCVLATVSLVRSNTKPQTELYGKKD